LTEGVDAAAAGVVKLGGAAAHCYFEFTPENLDVEALNRAVTNVRDRHEELRKVVVESSMVELPNSPQLLFRSTDPRGETETEVPDVSTAPGLVVRYGPGPEGKDIIAVGMDNLHLDGETKASAEDSNKVVTICTQYAQKGMFNIFLGVFFATLAFAFAEPFLFIGFLVAMALFGLYQAIFMANAGGAWDNAKKLVEVDLDAKNTPLHDATVVGDTVGDPYKDTSSVALNPVIKFSTLFGLLAVELATAITAQGLGVLAHVLAAVFLLVSAFFCYRSFYGMRIGERIEDIKA